ncbi:MAG: hypothetical protein ACWGNV_07950 [Bacteroidales bacterium]
MTLLILTVQLNAQVLPESDSSISKVPATGWADDAVTIGYVAAPSTLGLMFISALINEWNAGYAGIPASAMILLAPPIIYAGGRSAHLPKGLFYSRARLGWTLYAISIIPTTLALYSFTTDWGATKPLTLASGILGTGSIIAMTSYAFAISREALNAGQPEASAWNMDLMPLPGGALARITYTF